MSCSHAKKYVFKNLFCIKEIKKICNVITYSFLFFYRLEEKQRVKRRAREADAEDAAKEGRPYPPYEPLWFKKQQDDNTENLVHVYKGGYWESKKQHDWSKCPDIF